MTCDVRRVTCDVCLDTLMQLVLDTSQRGSGSAAAADVTLECDQMKRFHACMTARLQCASAFPWLLAYSRIDASGSMSSASSSVAAAAASKLHSFMMRALLLAESSIFAPEPKTRAAAAECMHALSSSGWLGPHWLPNSRLFNCDKPDCAPLSACECRLVAAQAMPVVAGLLHARVLMRLMQDMQPVRAMKQVAEYVLSVHAMVVAEGDGGGGGGGGGSSSSSSSSSSSNPLLAPFLSFVCQCLTYFSELIDAPAGGDGGGGDDA